MKFDQQLDSFQTLHFKQKYRVLLDPTGEAYLSWLW